MGEGMRGIHRSFIEEMRNFEISRDHARAQLESIEIQRNVWTATLPFAQFLKLFVLILKQKKKYIIFFTNICNIHILPLKIYEPRFLLLTLRERSNSLPFSSKRNDNSPNRIISVGRILGLSHADPTQGWHVVERERLAHSQIKQV